jgi:hypothetical protein
VFNNIGKSDVEFVFERVEPKCRVSGLDPQVRFGRRKDQRCHSCSGDFFDEPFLFLHIAQPQTKCDGPHTLHRLIRCLFAQIFVLEKKSPDPVAP